jgi:hypothetical protein
VDEYVVFTVNVPRDFEVEGLKRAIQSDRAESVLKGIDPHRLRLYKVSTINELRYEERWLISPSQPKDSNPIATMQADSLAERIGSMGDSLLKFADKLDPAESLFSIFSKQPPTEYIHIIVEVTGE